MSWIEHVSDRDRSGKRSRAGRKSGEREQTFLHEHLKPRRLKVCGVVLVKSSSTACTTPLIQDVIKDPLRNYRVILRTNNSLNQIQKSEPSWRWKWNHSRPVRKDSNIRRSHKATPADMSLLYVVVCINIHTNSCHTCMTSALPLSLRTHIGCSNRCGWCQRLSYLPRRPPPCDH